MLRELQRLHVPHTVRKLHVGDFVWVAQETRPRDPGKGQEQVWDAGLGGWREDGKTLLGFLAARPVELVLDHIVERKRLDDLCSSIIDGRFREQKVPQAASSHLIYFLSLEKATGGLKAEHQRPPVYPLWAPFKLCRCTVGPQGYLDWLEKLKDLFST